MRQKPIYQEIASLLAARANCKENGNTEWFDRHGENLDYLVSLLPHGAGIDCGTKLDEESCKPNLLVFLFEYHHMNDCGMYTGWTRHTLRVRPAFDGIDITISGPDRNDVKDYLYQTYYHALTNQVSQDNDGRYHVVRE